MLLYVESSLQPQKDQDGQNKQSQLGPWHRVLPGGWYRVLPGVCHRADLLGEVWGTSKASFIHCGPIMEKELKIKQVTLNLHIFQLGSFLTCRQAETFKDHN